MHALRTGPVPASCQETADWCLRPSLPLETTESANPIMSRLTRYRLYVLAPLLVAGTFLWVSSAVAQDGTPVYEEDFADDPNYTTAITSNVENDSRVFWDDGPDNFYVEARNSSSSDAWHAVGLSPTFQEVNPEDGFSISFQFNPVSIGDDRDPGLYFVDAGGTSSPPEKTRALEFVIDTENTNRKFRLTSSTGERFLSTQIPSVNEQYDVTLTYYPASQTVNVEILRQDGSTLVDQRRVSMAIPNVFDQVLIGEIEPQGSSYEFSGSAEIRIDDLQIRTNATRPVPPENPLAGASKDKAVLSWLSSTASDAAGYNVYRSTRPFDEISRATKVNSSLLSDTSFTNTGLSNGTTYYYRATTVDQDGNESRPSTQVTATPLAGETIVHSEDFGDDPGYTVTYTDNVQGNGVLSTWDSGPDNFYVEARNRNSSDAWHAVGLSPTFQKVNPEDGFSISFQFNPITVDDDRDPGLYFVEAGETSSPPDKTRALEFVIDTENANKQFRLSSSTGDQFLSQQIPSVNEQYEVTLTYYPASQTVDVEILRQDGSTLVDQRRVSMAVPNVFDQVLIGEIEPQGSSYEFSDPAEIRIDDLQIRTNATRPVPPENPLASASDAQTVLSWFASTTSDAAGYNVYRSTRPFDEIGRATKVNSSPLRSSRFTDTGLSNGTTYYYRATTVDQEGNESKPSPQVTVTPLAGETTVHSEDFRDDPGYTATYTSNVQGGGALATWDAGSDNFFVETRNRNSSNAWYTVGTSPTFPTIWPEDGFSISFQFNPITVDDDRDPGLYFVDAGGTSSPPDKTRALEFVIDTESANKQFRLSSSTGDQFLSQQIPSVNEQYEVTLTYYPTSQTVDIQILRQDGSALVDKEDSSLEVSKSFNQVLVGEIEPQGSSYQFSGYARIRVDDLQIRTGAMPPNPPSSLSAGASDGEVTLTWESTTDPDLEEYWVYRGTSAGFDPSGSRVATVGRNTTQYQDGSVTIGETYFYRLRAMDRYGFIGGLSPEVSATPGENLVASVSATVSSDGIVDFGATGVDIAFTGVNGSGTVTVEKFGDPPENVDGISESNVSSYRHVITADGDLTFGSNTEVQFAVASLEGISDPTNVSIYKRPDVGTGTFNDLSTTYDTNSDELLVTTGSFSEFALASNTEPLPVELAQFNGVVEDEEVLLKWQTASETNNSGFYVQRRASSDQDWTRLTFVDGSGTTTTPQTYRHRDSDLPYEPDSLVYRLKQVDADGSTSLSEPVTVRRGPPEKVKLLGTFPNPARSHATLQYALPQKQEVTLRLYDTLGRRVLTLTQGSMEAGREQLQIDTSDLSSGTYFLRLATEGVTRTQRLTVVR